MSLINFHRFLIATAIIFCLGFAYWELSQYQATGDLWAAVLGGGFGVAGLVLGYYLRHLTRILGISGQSSGNTRGNRGSFSPNGHKSPESEPISKMAKHNSQ